MKAKQKSTSKKVEESLSLNAHENTIQYNVKQREIQICSTWFLTRSEFKWIGRWVFA